MQRITQLAAGHVHGTLHVPCPALQEHFGIIPSWGDWLLTNAFMPS